jgi:HEAT repeat protein
MPLTKPRMAAPAPQADDYPVLLAALDDNAPVTRSQAALALSDHPAAAGALLARLPREDNAVVRSAIVTALTCIGNADAVSGLARCLGGEDVWLRNAAIEALRSLPEHVAPLMGHLLTDPDRDVRILALGVLDDLRHPDAERWLLHVLECDDDVSVCGAALDILAQLATPAVRSAVQALLQRFAAEPYVQFAGALVLRRIDGS